MIFANTFLKPYLTQLQYIKIGPGLSWALGQVQKPGLMRTDGDWEQEIFIFLIKLIDMLTWRPHSSLGSMADQPGMCFIGKELIEVHTDVKILHIAPPNMLEDTDFSSSRCQSLYWFSLHMLNTSILSSLRKTENNMLCLQLWRKS